MSRPPTLHKNYSLLAGLALVVLLAGCSLVGKREVVDGDAEGEPGAATNAKSVPKEQYDQLLAKYEAALRDRSKPGEAQEETPVEKDPSVLVEELGKAGRGELAETVDVFAKDTGAVPMGTSTPMGDGQVEEQIKSLHEAEALIGKNQFDAAMNILRPLEKSGVGQVRVRAKAQIGELLMRQGEYDLAMQVFEDVIQHDAFSGVVVKVLGKLIVCTEKLKLDKKKEQYYSMLHDFFEVE